MDETMNMKKSNRFFELCFFAVIAVFLFWRVHYGYYGADENFMGLGEQHARVDDVPHTSRRRGIFQAGAEGAGEIGLPDGAPRNLPGFVYPFQHTVTPQTSRRVFARARYSAAMGLSGKASTTVLPSSADSWTVSLRLKEAMTVL